MKAGVIIVVGIAALGGTARADRLDHDPMALDAIPDKLERSYSQQIADRLTWLGDEMNEHLGSLSLDRLAIRVDGRARRCRIRLGKGDGGLLSMRVDGDIKLERGLAQVVARIDLSVDGHEMHLDLPRVDFVPSTYDGETYLEVRLPLISGTFEPEDWFH